MFSWLGLAPALSNVVGPVLAGMLIDAAGFRSAFVRADAAAAGEPVVRAPGAARDAAAGGRGRRDAAGAWDLLLAPGMRRLLLVNWLLSSSWDVHAFLLPILGHERGFSASAIGVILGAFAFAVAADARADPAASRAVRASRRCWPRRCSGTACVFGVYPLARQRLGRWACARCCSASRSAAVQPMIMSTLHHITPDERHGEAIALRSMTINLSSTLMPLLFGARRRGARRGLRCSG